MKLTYKFTTMLLLAMCAVLAVHAERIARREIAMFNTDMRRDHHQLGNVLAAVLASVCRTDGGSSALRVLQGINEDARDMPVEIRWVALDAAPGQPDSPKIPASRLASLSEEHPVDVVDESADSPGVFYTYVALPMDCAPQAALELAESLDDEQTYVRATILRTVGTAGAIAAVSGLLALGFGAWIVGRPIRVLIDRARRVGAGDLAGRLHFRQHDELRELAEELNLMCQRLDEADQRAAAETAARIATMEQLRHADRLKSVGQLTSGIAHELGTPLNVARARAKMILTGEATGNAVPDSARIVVEQTDRMIGIIRQLLDFARPRAPSKVRADLGPIISRTLALLEPMARKRGVVLEPPTAGAAVHAHVDPDLIQQVLLNLVVNAIQASPTGKPVKVDLREERVCPPAGMGGPEGSYACVHVQDQGAGIAEADLPHIFDPFFSTKDVGEGTGLGLSVSRGIIQEHAGWIGVESRLGGGSRFSLYLPQG